MKTLISLFSLVFVGCVTGGSTNRAVAWNLRNRFISHCERYYDRRECLDLYKHSMRKTREGKGDRIGAFSCVSDNCSNSFDFKSCVYDCIDANKIRPGDRCKGLSAIFSC